MILTSRLAAFVVAAQAPFAPVDFARDVRPILATSCISCHGPETAENELRVDSRAALLRGGLSASALVPGSGEASLLYQRLVSDDPDFRMPYYSDPLTEAQIETIRRWIDEGAPWPDGIDLVPNRSTPTHWSFVPPERPSAPALTPWARGPIDAFVLARIDEHGLAPSPEAERSVLLRRLSFDLTGLPPTPEESARFDADEGPDAYEKEVDRLLSSPAYGERMASYWLDLVRYADSVGYHSDNARNVWRYRDWVVDAFNKNLPFDRFTLEQLAGDLLPDATTEQKIASGYNRLLQTTEEGGAQPKEYRAIYLADRVRNVSSVWLGATLGCAQCHDHKFDPFLARDFYSMAAFFADVREPPVGRRKTDALPSEAERPAFEAAEAEVERLEEELERPHPGQHDWEASLRGPSICWTTLEPVEVSSVEGTRVLIQGNDFSLIATTATGPKPLRDTYTVRFETDLEDITRFRLDAVPFEELPKGGPGRDPDGGFVVTGIELTDESGRSVARRSETWGLNEADGESHALLLDATAERKGALTLVLHQNAGDGRTLGRFGLAATEAPLDTCTDLGPALTKGVLSIAETPPSDRTPDQEEEIATFYRGWEKELAPLRAELYQARLRRDALLENIPQSLVTTAVEPDPVRILPRGNWLDDSGAIVEPGVPRFLRELPSNGRASRLDLARWLTSSENPLTARVLSNRLWKLFLGRGLVSTLEDFGTQGERPTHPELLDWLAVELVENGWDVKHVVRTIVTSATYRQSSRPSPELLARDPENLWYARQSRLRLDAEMVRDNALAVSGLLSKKMGGPSVFPHQPPGYWTFLNFPPREWDDSKGEDQYRRGLYTWWQRSFLQPSLLAFDAPTREECVAQRTRANVPQQALVLLNDPTYVEAARAFAERIVNEGESSLDWAYRVALSRSPREEERLVLQKLHEKGGWFPVARAILNLPELITRP
jgi:hypothetical protein